MDTAIRTERLTKYYGRQRGVVELDLEVEQGEIFGYLGPNGAGKTTTIRVLLDLIRPTSGRAFVFDIEASVHQAELRFSGPVPAATFAAIPGVSLLVSEDHILRMHVQGPIAPVVKAAAAFDLVDFVSREPTLEEVFLAQYGKGTIDVQ